VVLAALGAAVWSGLIVGSVEQVIDGMVRCVLDDALSLFLELLLEVDAAKCGCVSACVQLLDGEKREPEHRGVESIDFVLLWNINQFMVAYCILVVISKRNDLLPEEVS
jgi:hypothetical protein